MPETLGASGNVRMAPYIPARRNQKLGILCRDVKSNSFPGNGVLATNRFSLLKKTLSKITPTNQPNKIRVIGIIHRTRVRG
jgi:hypothetical protein